MKRQDNWGVGSSIFLSIVFAGMAILTYQSDPSIAFIPVIGVLVGIVMAIKAANKVADESAKKEQQEKFSAIDRDAFGELKPGEKPNLSVNFFTGKPEIEGLGYSFLFRNYRADLGK